MLDMRSVLLVATLCLAGAAAGQGRDRNPRPSTPSRPPVRQNPRPAPPNRPVRVASPVAPVRPAPGRPTASFGGGRPAPSAPNRTHPKFTPPAGPKPPHFVADPKHWRPPHRAPVYHGWNPRTWQHDYLGLQVWVCLGTTYNWNPAQWSYPVPPEVGGLVYRAGRISADMTNTFDAAIGDYGLDFYHAGAQAQHRMHHLDAAIGVLISATGTSDPGVMPGLVQAVITATTKMQDSFTRHPYLLQLVPDYWTDLTNTIQSLADYYGLPTDGS